VKDIGIAKVSSYEMTLSGATSSIGEFAESEDEKKREIG
jgi:hypothetical protein